MGARLIAAAFAIMLALSAAPAAAQAPAAPAPGLEGVPAADLEALVETLEDDAARARLVGDIKALIEARRATEPDGPARGVLSASLFSFIADQADAVNERLSGTLELLADLPALTASAIAVLRDPAQRQPWLQRLGLLLLLFAAAGLLEALVRGPATRAADALGERPDGGYLLRLPFAIARLAVRLLPVAAFLALFYGGLSVIGGGGPLRGLVLSLAHAYAGLRMVMIIGEVILAPRRSGVRLLPLEDETVAYLLLWLRRLSVVVIGGYFTVAAAASLGLPSDGLVVLSNLIGLVAAAMASILLLQNRREVGDAMRQIATTDSRAASVGILVNRLADIWHVLAVVYIATVFVVWASDVEGGFEFVSRATVLSVAVLIAARLASVAIRRGIDRAFALNDEVRTRFPELEKRANRYLPALRGLLQGLVTLLTVLALLQVWGVDSFAWIATDAGRTALGAGLSIALTLLLALMIWEGVTAALERYLEQLESGGGMFRAARARTLVPMVRKVFLAVLLSLVVLIVLSELGINIGPLLAGAGIVGIAVGFGAQKLVQDVITGAFLIVEDTLSVGDVVQAGSEAGVVEAINLRTVRLRDVRGNVHTIPYSTLDRITNMTKDFSRYVFDVGVAYREDLDAVMDVLRELGREMREDPDFGPLIRKDLEILGVDQFADSAIIIKARFETLPIKQWIVGREFNRRMKRRFDELGIEIPFPHQTVYFGVDRDGTAPPARVRMEDADPPPAPPIKPAKPADGRKDQSRGDNVEGSDDGALG